MAANVEAKTAVIVALISSIGGGFVGNLVPTLIDFENQKTADELKQAQVQIQEMKVSQDELSRNLELQRAGRQSCVGAIDEYLAKAP